MCYSHCLINATLYKSTLSSGGMQDVVSCRQVGLKSEGVVILVNFCQ